jgi:hypothetical protein
MFDIPQPVSKEFAWAPDFSTSWQTAITSALEAGWNRVADEPHSRLTNDR